MQELKENSDLKAQLRDGTPLPLGPSKCGTGVNFAIFSQYATHIRIELFDHHEDAKAARVIDLDPIHNRTSNIWHVWIEDIKPGQLYAYRVDGPYNPKDGHRFNFNKLLLDPYAKEISRLPSWNFGPARGYDFSVPYGDALPSKIDDAGCMPKCVFTEEHFEWQGDHSPRLPWAKVIIYELHVRGFTNHPSSGVKHPGTYRGLIEKIPYLKELGVTAVELMPVQEFNENQPTGKYSPTGKALKNYWGYDPVAFFAPKASYSSLEGVGHQKIEFKEMVQAFHKAGIEVILDVVFNHTSEGNELGPTLSFRGIDNRIFYMLADDKRFYKDYSGTGNTINANHPVVRDHILTALRYWVEEMHVDGFRFDLATVLDRDCEGKLLSNAPVLELIADDNILKDVRIIAEPWDAAGGYEVGIFSKRRWAEWNGRYRDVIRKFWRGDDGVLGLFAQRICGSADIYSKSGKGPESSINFITCHDGFTLNDLVSYNSKHNEGNGENNQDGTDENLSANYGVEGKTEDVQIEDIRKRQIKNFLLTLLISRGVPMLSGGDEFRRTQDGNNNPYCQDNEISWFNWNHLKQNQEVFNFTRDLLSFRRDHPILSKEEFYTDTEIQWFNPQGELPNWDDSNNKQLACLIHENPDSKIYLMFNVALEGFDFSLPKMQFEENWQVFADTSHVSIEQTRIEKSNTYHLESRSSAILLACKK